ncbi:MAG: class I SAM-dependent methyltransferase [Bdellovibrionales bacterium]|nr:class I SAM-dependent methyltransferase [Bdellovibrionales bacterium]
MRKRTSSSENHSQKRPSLPFELKYQLYEASVQDPDSMVAVLEQIYREAIGGSATTLREDFCGTFWNSVTWVRAGADRRAIGLDISEEPIAYGHAHHAATLSANERRRLDIRQANVLQATTPKVDIISASNFSFYVFKERQTLVRYFKSCHRSLGSNGVLVLEMVGGPGFVDTPSRETRTIKHERGPHKGSKWFTYTWDQRKFNPVNRNGLYSIHFRMADGTSYRQAFTYDWRIWTMPEVRDCLAEAGFSDTAAYWETTDEDGDLTGTWERAETADNDHTWIGYAVGIKTSGKSRRRPK